MSKLDEPRGCGRCHDGGARIDRGQGRFNYIAKVLYVEGDGKGREAHE